MFTFQALTIYKRLNQRTKGVFNETASGIGVENKIPTMEEAQWGPKTINREASAISNLHK